MWRWTSTPLTPTAAYLELALGIVHFSEGPVIAQASIWTGTFWCNTSWPCSTFRWLLRSYKGHRYHRHSPHTRDEIQVLWIPSCSLSLVWLTRHLLFPENGTVPRQEGWRKSGCNSAWNSCIWGHMKHPLSWPPLWNCADCYTWWDEWIVLHKAELGAGSFYCRILSTFSWDSTFSLDPKGNRLP